ncbi:DNA resolvase [Burkholderia ubonensis]|uniref:recombinase family protein n=1 Tax=Burkholderia ubonensis TaxID=101571 RepID=UPI0007531444|nr:recombinase family protein [Burkholderia ubonensis]KVU82741.1 DNA resolvase [Burkholderia ubonensis]OJB11372.1 DNA resolvase [Burkholderia ubonensis]OJB20598.1 DNA resolvase [Burkholderia ubonensis]OJB29705.1 DNA resolvase [Burkholderia ubonensis]
MKVGYARVSTEEQHLDLQISALQGCGCDVIFSDQGISGVCSDRPGLKAALDAISDGSTLVVWRLDRLGRSISHLIQIITQLGETGVEFVSLTECIDTGSPVGRFTFHMIAALAEFERALISERTRAGLLSARRRGSKLGRPFALSVQDQVRARSLLGAFSEAEVATLLSVHVRTLRRYLRDERYQTIGELADG